jgi:hypothetical protein
MAPCFAFLAWAALMGLKAALMYSREDSAKLSPTQRHRLIVVVVAFFGVQAAMILLVVALSGNLIAWVLAALTLVLLLRYIGLEWSGRSSS